MRYTTPTTTKEAAALMAKAKGNAFVLAGGTDLLVRMKSGLSEPDLIVDIKKHSGNGVDQQVGQRLQDWRRRISRRNG